MNEKFSSLIFSKPSRKTKKCRILTKWLNGLKAANRVIELFWKIILAIRKVKMNNEKIVLVARVKVKKESVEEAKQAALVIVADSRAEAGCLNYDIHQAIDDETIFVWHETWANQNALDEHFAKPYFNEFFAKVEEFKAEPAQLTLTKMISEKI
jgi:quinol monooxygenase YgiN